MVSGLLKTLVVVAITYAFLTVQNIPETLNLTVGEVCLIIITAYFSFYSYSLFFNAILPYNFIGIRLITPIFLVCLVYEYGALFLEHQLDIEINPSRWVVAIFWSSG